MTNISGTYETKQIEKSIYDMYSTGCIDTQPRLVGMGTLDSTPLEKVISVKKIYNNSLRGP